MKRWEESWAVGLGVLGLLNADESSAHHRKPAGTSASRNQVCFGLETRWLWVILCPLVPLGDCLGDLLSQFLGIFHRFPAQMCLWRFPRSFLSQRTVLAQTALLPACTLRCRTETAFLRPWVSEECVSKPDINGLEIFPIILQGLHRLIARSKER